MPYVPTLSEFRINLENLPCIQTSTSMARSACHVPCSLIVILTVYAIRFSKARAYLAQARYAENIVSLVHYPMEQVGYTEYGGTYPSRIMETIDHSRHPPNKKTAIACHGVLTYSNLGGTMDEGKTSKGVCIAMNKVHLHRFIAGCAFVLDLAGPGRLGRTQPGEDGLYFGTMPSKEEEKDARTCFYAYLLSPLICLSGKTPRKKNNMDSFVTSTPTTPLKGLVKSKAGLPQTPSDQSLPAGRYNRTWTLSKHLADRSRETATVFGREDSKHLCFSPPAKCLPISVHAYNATHHFQGFTDRVKNDMFCLAEVEQTCPIWEGEIPLGSLVTVIATASAYPSRSGDWESLALNVLRVVIIALPPDHLMPASFYGEPGDEEQDYKEALASFKAFAKPPVATCTSSSKASSSKSK